MASRIFLVILLLASMGGTAWARKKKNPPADANQMAIVEVSPIGVTVDAGNGVQASYDITDNTKVTFNGLPVPVDDLRAGMLAAVSVSSDGRTALTIAAVDAPKDPPPKAHHDNVWINLK